MLAPALLTLGELTFVCAFDLVAAQAVCRLTGESVVVVLALALLTLGDLTLFARLNYSRLKQSQVDWRMEQL